MPNVLVAANWPLAWEVFRPVGGELHAGERAELDRTHSIPLDAAVPLLEYGDHRLTGDARLFWDTIADSMPGDVPRFKGTPIASH